MSGVFEGFGVIGILIALGFALARFGILQQEAQRVLARLVYFVASPALLIDLLSRTDVGDALGVGFAVAVLCVVAVLLVYVPIARWRRWSVSHTVIGALSASYANAGFLGLPIAVYVLDDATFVLPLLVLQLLIFAPLALAVLDLDVAGRRPTLWSFLSAGLRNPVSIGASLGLALSVSGWRLPSIAGETLSLLGGMAVPAALLTYGISLHFGGAVGSAHRREIVLISVLKLGVQPVVAYALARWVFDLESHEVFGLTIMAALPTAQNVFIYATRVGRAELLARDSIAVTTLASVPVLFGLAALLA